MEAEDSLGYKRVGEKATQTSRADGDSSSITVIDETGHRSEDLKTEVIAFTEPFQVVHPQELDF